MYDDNKDLTMRDRHPKIGWSKLLIAHVTSTRWSVVENVMDIRNLDSGGIPLVNRCGKYSLVSCHKRRMWEGGMCPHTDSTLKWAGGCRGPDILSALLSVTRCQVHLKSVWKLSLPDFTVTVSDAVDSVWGPQLAFLTRSLVALMLLV